MAAIEQPSDEELASRARRGCLDSFQRLVRRLQVPLVHFLRRRVSESEADDLAQETFLRAFQHLDQYDDGYRFRPWLFTMAHRLSINASRRRQPSGQVAHWDQLPDDAPAPSQQADDEEQRERLWRAAAEVLDEIEVTALWLHYVEELSTEEIGRVLGRSRSAVKTMLFRARRRLADKLPQHVREEVGR